MEISNSTITGVCTNYEEEHKGPLISELCPVSKFTCHPIRACHSIGLPRLLSPHQARHGGPSHDFFLKVRESVDVQARGRWASISSVARCKKPGAYLVQLGKLSEDLKLRAGVLKESLPRDMCWAV